MELLEWQKFKKLSSRQAAYFMGVPKGTYEKWLYQIVSCPEHVKKLIKFDLDNYFFDTFNALLKENIEKLITMSKIEIVSFFRQEGLHHPFYHDKLSESVDCFLETTAIIKQALLKTSCEKACLT